MALTRDTLRPGGLDPAFLRRYDLQGPRYTSYPTVPEWSAEITGAETVAHLVRMRAGTSHPPFKPLSIYVHLPFCIEHCAFCACNVIVSPKMEAVSEPYLAVLNREVALWAEALDTRRPVTQLHWGGGTPTYLNSGQIRRTHAMITERFAPAPDAEQSIEVHASWTSDEQMRTLASLGFNRLSLGVQDFNPRTQEAIRRRQTPERTREIIMLARELGFTGINIDLVYGLPHQTAASFGETVERVLELRPDRLAVYNFAYLPERLAHQRAIDPGTLPDGAEKFRIFLEAHDRFHAAGYRHIGMDHYALPEDELTRAFDAGTMQRNFMGFTTRAGTDLVGMGVSSIGFLDGMYVQNVKKPPAWREAVEAGRFAIERGLRLSADDLLRRDVIAGLMCGNHLDRRTIEARHGIDFNGYFAKELERLAPMIEDGLLTVGREGIDLTFTGRLFVRNIAMVFDAYLNKPREGKRKMFSRTL